MRRRLRSFAASWLLNALLRIFAMSIITPKRKVLRMSVQDCRSEERFSRNAETDLVCRLLLEKKKNPRLVLPRTAAFPLCRGIDGELVISDGVRRATRVAK